MALKQKLADFQNALERLQEAHNKTITYKDDENFVGAAPIRSPRRSLSVLLNH